MADLYLSRKVAGASSPLSGQGALYWSPDSPKLLSKTSKISGLTQEETDVEELEMLLEVIIIRTFGNNHDIHVLKKLHISAGLLCAN